MPMPMPMPGPMLGFGGIMCMPPGGIIPAIPAIPPMGEFIIAGLSCGGGIGNICIGEIPADTSMGSVVAVACVAAFASDVGATAYLCAQQKGGVSFG